MINCEINQLNVEALYLILLHFRDDTFLVVIWDLDFVRIHSSMGQPSNLKHQQP